MFKVIIADDEAPFRRYLRNAVDWAAHGFELAGEARNGLEALELARDIRPDIALVDINMPYMDGLALSEKLREIFPEIVIIIVTGHSEFEYARKALKIGVVDYILKPFSEEELLVVLLKVGGSLQKAFEKKFVAQSNAAVLKERFLNLLISNEYSAKDEEIAKQFMSFGISTFTRCFTVASVEIDNLYQRWKDAGEIQLWKYAVSNVLDEIMKADGNCTIFNGSEGRIISILEFRNELDMHKLRVEGVQRACDFIGKHMGFTVTIGVGRTVKGFSSIHNSYKESLAALQNKVAVGNGKVIKYADLESKSMNVGFYSNEVNEKLQMSLRLNNWEEIEEELEEVFNYVHEKNLSWDYTYTILMGLVSICLSFITENGSGIEDVLGSKFSPYSEMRSLESFESICRWIKGMFKKAVEYSNENRITKSRKIVETVKEYIENNYGDNDLSVEKIAGSIYINSSYLRKVFKKELNLTVSDCIASIRMQKAKELINSRNIRLADISEMVGYCDASHFSKSFKKHFGMSPSEYENIRK